MSDFALPRRRARAAEPRYRDPDFRSLLGETAWTALPAAVRARFDAAHRPVSYEGQMLVRANGFGRLLGHLCRLIGTPLAPWQGEAVPTVVDVRRHPDGGVVWARTYAFDGGRRITVSSRKVTMRGDLAEVVSGGLGMWLRASVEDAALVFESCGYFLELGPVRLRIPDLLTPGRARVEHADLGEGRFRFSMSFTHAWAGETIFHTGVFADPEAAA